MQALIGQRLLKTIEPKSSPYEIRDTRLKGFILRVQKTGAMSYICEYARGKRITIGKVGTLKPDQARDRAADLIHQAKKGIDPMAEKRRERGLTLGQYIEQKYGPWVEAHRKDGAATIARINSCFHELFKFPLSDITAWQVEKWKTTRIKHKDKPAKPATVNRDITALKAALSKAVEWGLIDTHPLTKVRPAKVDKQKKIRFLSDDEERRLRQAIENRSERLRTERDSANTWRAQRNYPLLPNLRAVRFADHIEPMVLLSLNTGMRRGELFNLSWQDVDLAGAWLTIEGETAKSGNTRHIPLNAEALDTLKHWRGQSKGDGLVFPGKDGQPFVHVKKAWGGLLKDAGITGFRWHDMRHHFASQLVRAGVALNTVRELLGHADIKMTLRYAHLAPDDKANAVALLNRRLTTENHKGHGVEL